MSQPFIARVQQLIQQRTDMEIVQTAIDVIQKNALKSTAATLTLDEVAWLAAFIGKASSGARDAMMKRDVAVDENGTRVINITADDSVKAADGAG